MRFERGNAAAMREALVSVRALIADEPDGTPMIDAMKATIDAALAAPARNCDRFADAESARQAWLDDADNWDDFGSPKLELHEWLLAPAAERKGEDYGK